MTECKLLTNGLTIKTDGIVRPCCVFNADHEWRENNHYTNILDIENWHNSPQIIEKREMLKAGIWPDSCHECKSREESGRDDSVRKTANSSYHNYNKKDIFLEVRPGNICNFACQSCDPESSTRIRHFMHKAELIDKKTINISAITDFKFLEPISHRIKDVSVLGGEPFYDKNCLSFLKWTEKNLFSNIVIFTNGLYIDYDFIEKYNSTIILVFSIDAVDKPADYIRYGSNWEKIKENYYKCKTYNNIDLRVNVTTSAYNFCYLEKLLDFFKDDWPDLITFGSATESHLTEQTIPLHNRKKIIESLGRIPKKIWSANIQKHQQHNTMNAISSIIKKLKYNDFSEEHHNYLCSYIKKMDLVKKIDIKEYCPELYDILFH